MHISILSRSRRIILRNEYAMAEIISNTVCPQIGIIFANAGLAKLAPFGSVNEKFFDLHFDANVKGLFFSVQKGRH